MRRFRKVVTKVSLLYNGPMAEYLQFNEKNSIQEAQTKVTLPPNCSLDSGHHHEHIRTP